MSMIDTYTTMPGRANEEADPRGLSRPPASSPDRPARRGAPEGSWRPARSRSAPGPRPPTPADPTAARRRASTTARGPRPGRRRARREPDRRDAAACRITSRTMSRAARAERQPRAQLARAPPHAVGHHAVDADRRQRERNERRSRRAAASPAATPPPTRRRCPTACAPRRAARRVRPARTAARIAGSAASGSPVVRTKSVTPLPFCRSNGKYRSARGASLSEARRMSPTRPTISAVPSPSADPLADRVLAREVALGDRVADDHDRRAVERVARVEEPAVAQRDAQRAEVAARRRLPAHFRRPLRPRAADAPAERAAPSSCCRSAASPRRRRRASHPAAALRARRTRADRPPIAPAARCSGPAGRPICTVSTPSAVKPGSTAISLAKLRSVRPAPMSSTTASAISAATSPEAARRAPPLIVARRWPTSAPRAAVARQPQARHAR